VPQFAHLIFDLDGTLVDTSADLTAATNHVRETFGLSPLSIAQVSGYVGDGIRVLVERALGPAHARLVSRGVDQFLTYYQDHLLNHTQPYPGIEPFLAMSQAQGLVLSVLTNKMEVSSRAILSGLGLAAFFTAIVGGDTLPVKKPDPQGVRYLQHLTNIEPAKTLLIGDSRIDVETGHAAGLATCGVTWGFNPQSLTTLPPQFLVDSPAQLQQLILSTV